MIEKENAIDEKFDPQFEESDGCDCKNEDFSLCGKCKMYCHCSKIRSEKEYKDMINRLNRIAGQIKGIRGMVEKNAYCIDILNQVSAASAALSSFTKVLLGNHIRTCVAEDIRAGREDTVEELVCALQKLMH